MDLEPILGTLSFLLKSNLDLLESCALAQTNKKKSSHLKKDLRCVRFEEELFTCLQYSRAAL